MKLALPRACYIGFTGTPLLRGDKPTVQQFGGIIGEPYTIAQAVEDKAVVPLVYEGPACAAEHRRAADRRWFEKYTSALTPSRRRT
jgi:type I restriction enzyme, R subunit